MGSVRIICRALQDTIDCSAEPSFIIKSLAGKIDVITLPEMSAGDG